MFNFSNEVDTMVEKEAQGTVATESVTADSSVDTTLEAAMESGVSPSINSSKYVAKITKIVGKKKTVAEVKAVQDSVESEIRSMNGILKGLYNAIQNKEDNKITAAELKTAVDKANAQLSAKIVFMKKAFGGCSVDIKSIASADITEDVKELKLFLVGARKVVTERIAELSKEEKPEEEKPSNEPEKEAEATEGCGSKCASATESMLSMISELEIAQEALEATKTTWRIKHGALRKQVAAFKRQAGKSLADNQHKEALGALSEAKSTLAEIGKTIDNLTMSDYRNLKKGSDETESSFKAYKENLRKWVENENKKLDDFIERVKAKQKGKEKPAKATESLIDVDGNLDVDAALEAWLNSKDEAEVATESDTAIADEYDFDVATESFCGLDLENSEVDLALEVALASEE